MKQIKYSCDHCGAEWFTNKRELRESKKSAKAIFIQRNKRSSAILPSTFTKRTAALQVLQATHVDPTVCPNCKSKDTTRW